MRGGLLAAVSAGCLLASAELSISFAQENALPQAHSVSAPPSPDQQARSKSEAEGGLTVWGDPRWWAIAANFLLTGCTFFYTQWAQSRNRIRDGAAEDFDARWASPLRDAQTELRKLVTAVKTASDIVDQAIRASEVQKILEGVARSALDAFQSALAELEESWPDQGWLDVCVALDEQFPQQMQTIKLSSSVQELQSLANSIRSNIHRAIHNSNELLVSARSKYVLKVVNDRSVIC